MIDKPIISPAVTVAGTPRSEREMEFVAQMRPCPACGDRGEVDWQVAEREGQWSTAGTCEACGATREYRFAHAPLEELDPFSFELGRGPSTVIDRDALTREIERVTPVIPHEPKQDELEPIRKRALRTAVALSELGKLLPEHARPIAEKIEYWQRVAAEADPMPAIEDHVKASRTPPDALGHATRAAHRAWLMAGRAGPGRIELDGFIGAGIQIPGSVLAGARLAYVDFRCADLRRTEWDDVELVEGWFVHARINAASFARASISTCTFDHASAKAARFSEARLDGAAFDHADLRGADFRGATAVDCYFSGARLDGATMTGARFDNCMFDRATVRGSLSGAVFERCEFRHVDFTGMHLAQMTFVDCGFEGAIGMEWPAPSRSTIAAMSTSMSPLLRVSRVLEQRGVPQAPALNAVELAGETSAFLAVSALHPRAYLLLPYSADVLAAVAPGASAGALPARPMLKVYIDRDQVDVSLVAVGGVPPNEAVDVAPAAARAAWLDKISKLPALGAGRITSRMRYLTRERATIGYWYERRGADADSRLVTGIDQLAWSLGVPGALRELWKTAHEAMGGGQVTVTTACAADGPAAELTFLYRDGTWDQAVELCKLVASPDEARGGAAMLGSIAGTLALDKTEGVELVLGSGEPDVVVWLLPAVR